MASFAPWAAALAGFRLVRARPIPVMAWAGVIFLGRLAALVLTTAICGPSIPALDAAVNAKIIDPQAVVTAYRAVAPGYLAGAILVMPFAAIVTSAVYRAYLRPQEGRWCFLRVGVREAAILALIVSLNLILMVGLFLSGALIAAAANLVADETADSMIEIVGLAGMIYAVIWVLIRLALAWPMTFQSGRLALRPSWRLTQPQAWSVLSAFLIAEGLMLLVAALLFTVCIGLAGAIFAAMGGSLDHMSDALKPAQTLAQVFMPLPMIFAVFEAVMLALWAAALGGVAVCAYHVLAPADPLGEATPVSR
jgi:hypothetical protein